MGKRIHFAILPIRQNSFSTFIRKNNTPAFFRQKIIFCQLFAVNQQGLWQPVPIEYKRGKIKTNKGVLYPVSLSFVINLPR